MTTTIVLTQLTTQQRIYEYIVEYMSTHQGKSPQYRDIGAAVGIESIGNVTYHVKALAVKGKLLILAGHGGILLPDQVFARVLYGTDERLKVQVVKDGKTFEGLVQNKEDVPERATEGGTVC